MDKKKQYESDESDSSDTDTGERSKRFVFDRSRARTKEEDRWRRHYRRRRKKSRGYSSPETEEDKRSLTPYNIDRYIKKNKKKKKRKQKKKMAAMEQHAEGNTKNTETAKQLSTEGKRAGETRKESGPQNKAIKRDSTNQETNGKTPPAT